LVVPFIADFAHSFLINITNDVVDICLEMCVPAEQTVAMRKAKFWKRVILTTCGQTFAVEAAKELATL